MAETVSGIVAGNISSVYSIIRQKTSDIQETFEKLATNSGLVDKQRSLSTLSSRSTSDDNHSNRTSQGSKCVKRVDSAESDSLSENIQKNETQILNDDTDNKEDQLIYLLTNILYTVLWHGIDNNGGDS